MSAGRIPRGISWWRRVVGARRATQRPRAARLVCEMLEDRSLLSAAAGMETLLVQTKAEFAAETMARWLTHRLPKSGVLETTPIPGLFEVHVKASQTAALAKRIRANAKVAYVEKESLLQIQLAPNDPRYTDGTLYGLNGAFGIEADKAWDVTTGSTAVTVAVIDTGVDYTHPDLYLNIWINQAEIPAGVIGQIKSDPNWDVDGDGLITFRDLNDPRNQAPRKIMDLDGDGRITAADILKPFSQGGWSDDTDADGNGLRDDLIGWNYVSNTNNPFDDNHHGTHVAGTIGAMGNNATGGVGVNWNVQIMAVKSLDGTGNGTSSNAASAIRFAADHGAQISNNSWGGGGVSSTLFNAISYAATTNQLFVAAAGNGGSDNDAAPFYPASYNLPNIVSVAATTDTGALASFSNYGATTVDLAAPGHNIYSTWPNNSYAFSSGTSMAAPHVAGAAALILADQPGIGYADLKELILGNVRPLPALAGTTISGGLPNVWGAVKPLPEIGVFDGAVSLTDGVSSVSFGVTSFGQTVSKTFTVKNIGDHNLILGTPIAVPAGFTLTSGFGVTSLGPGESTTFTVRFDAAALGTFGGTVSFANNDADENPFDFTISGSVANVRIIDNGESGFSTTGAWTPYFNQGYLNDIHYAAAGNGSDIARWTYAVTPGIYRVSATWYAFYNRATDSPFTVMDGGSALATVRVNQQLAPGDFTDAGVGWADLGGSYAISGSSLVVELTNNANQYVIADAIRVERLGELPNGPEIQVLDAGANLSDGAATVAFGSAAVDAPVSKTFTVKNVGNQDLVLGSISVPPGFTVTSGFGATTLAPAASTTFIVRLDAAAAGSYSGQLSFANNDADENPFDFIIQGTVSVPSSVQIIDNGEAGFSTVGGWSPYANEGYRNDIHYSAAGDGSNVASWTFTVTPGIYRVWATWNALSNRASNSPFSVFDGAAPLATVTLNQQAAPNDFSDAGAWWEDIGGNYSITGGTLSVRLTNNANQYVIADAIRIQRLGELPNGPEIQVQDGGSDLANGAAIVNFGSTPPGTPVSKTFTVKNLGNQDLTLGPISLPSGFALTADFSASTLAPGASTTFTVRLDAAATGLYSGELSFATNDADENPFRFTIQGTVASLPAVQIIDNGDAGFTTVGTWSPFANQGYQDDIHYSAAGSGADVAAWTFTVAPGVYRVAATWHAFYNRATDSPFTVYDGGGAFATVRLNQQLAPNDFVDGGAAWEDIGVYTITGDTLVVKLANNANQYVIADAIRIEKIG